MAYYFMFGKYSQEAVKGITAKRTERAENLIKELGGEVKSAYALMGNYDLVLITRFPQLQDAIKASLALFKLTGISFSTSPAVSIEDFDALAAET